MGVVGEVTALGAPAFIEKPQGRRCEGKRITHPRLVIGNVPVYFAICPVTRHIK